MGVGLTIGHGQGFDLTASSTALLNLPEPTTLSVIVSKDLLMPSTTERSISALSAPALSPSRVCCCCCCCCCCTAELSDASDADTDVPSVAMVALTAGSTAASTATLTSLRTALETRVFNFWSSERDTCKGGCVCVLNHIIASFIIASATEKKKMKGRRTNQLIDVLLASGGLVILRTRE